MEQLRGHEREEGEVGDPRDVGGAIVSLDRPLPPASWRWAGPGWEEKGRNAEARAAMRRLNHLKNKPKRRFTLT